MNRLRGRVNRLERGVIHRGIKSVSDADSFGKLEAMSMACFFEPDSIHPDDALVYPALRDGGFQSLSGIDGEDASQIEEFFAFSRKHGYLKAIEVMESALSSGACCVIEGIFFGEYQPGQVSRVLRSYSLPEWGDLDTISTWNIRSCSMKQVMSLIGKSNEVTFEEHQKQVDKLNLDDRDLWDAITMDVFHPDEERRSVGAAFFVVSSDPVEVERRQNKLRLTFKNNGGGNDPTSAG